MCRRRPNTASKGAKFRREFRGYDKIADIIDVSFDDRFNLVTLLVEGAPVHCVRK